MNQSQLSKTELLEKGKELEIPKCKSKTKNELISIIQKKETSIENVEIESNIDNMSVFTADVEFDDVKSLKSCFTKQNYEICPPKILYDEFKEYISL